MIAAWSAWQARPTASRVLDLGCGHGTVTLLTSAMLPDAEFVCVEAQEISAQLCARNLALNNLTSRARIIHCDLRDLESTVTGFDLITGTPPFMPEGSGVLPADPQRAAARFEMRGGIEAYCRAAAGRLNPGGRVSMVMDGAQDPRCRAAFAAAGLALTDVVRVIPRWGKACRYIAYVGVRDAEASVQERELVVRGAEGEYSPDYVAIRQTLRLEAPS